MHRVRLAKPFATPRAGRLPASLAVSLAAISLLPACGETSRVRYAPGVDASSIAPEPVDSVEVLDAEPARAFRSLGQVTALADARYEANIAQAEARARRELRRAAADAGAHGVIIDERRVQEVEAAWDATPLTPDFEGDTRDLLSPGRPGAAAGKRLWRVRLVGRAIVFEQ